ncbi:MAG: alkaline phosphatase family protein, partial [Chitinophagaceae bacterium]
MPANFANPAIKHVFVLMLENRSFDHMLGFINGNDISQYSNSYTYGNPPVTHVYHPVTPAHCSMKFDPGHEFPDVVKQLCGPDASYPAGGKYPIINNSGFVYNYATTHSSHEGGATGDFGEIMKCYDTNRQLPVMSSLVNNFMLCDNWFASIPGPTWPNRFFVHAASSNGFDTSPTMSEILEWETIHGFSFPNKSIYHRLKKYRKKYRLYRGVSSPLTGSIPGVAALKGIFLWETNKYENFENDLHGNYPFDYTFIEPNYGDIINNSYKGGQSQHPMDDVRGGEALIKSTYEAIRNSPLWKNSMLIITYDEHGGFYDHVA